MAIEALVGAVVFDGERRHERSAVLLDGDRIAGIVDVDAVPRDARVTTLAGGWLAPGFVDAQVNGGGGALFNAMPTVEALDTIAAMHRRYGTTALLPTLITATPELTQRAIEAAAQAVRTVPGIAGLHLEGPHLAPARRGAHREEWMRPLGDDDVDRLVAAKARVGTLMVTLAVERASPARIRRLADAGIVVSIGHSDASYDDAMRAFEAGATGVTHLYNAMSPLRHREPGLVGAALDCGTACCGIIVDGQHVHPAALRAALRGKRGPGRLFLVTDAMPTVGAAGDRFELDGRVVTRAAGRLTLDDGTLAGSDLDMATAVRNAAQTLEQPVEEALRMASLYPARLLGIDAHHGRIAAGRPADLVYLDDDLQVQGVWLGGRAGAAGD